MLNYWAKKNKVTTKALQVQYVSSFSRRYHSVDVYESHRIVTKSYSYIGMTEAAAKACQAAKLAQYTRTFIQWYNANGVWKGSSNQKIQCVANVSMNQDDGGLWSVSIDVNEDQQQYSTWIPIDYDLFDYSLDYDEDTPAGEMLCISNVWRADSKLHVAYVQDISGFSTTSALFHVEQSTDGGTTWTAATPSSSTAGLLTFVADTWTPGLIRLRWGDSVLSNAEPTPADQYANTLTLYTPAYSSGAWRMRYAQDIRDFSPSSIVVFASTDGGATWTDITESCTVTDRIIVTPHTEQSYRCSYRISCASADSGIVSIPYDPSGDTGDGSISVYGAANHALIDAKTDSTFWRLTLCPSGAFVNAKLAVKYSEDGYTWSDAALDFTPDGGSKYTGTVVVDAQIPSGKRYCKCVYDGVQASDVFVLPYKGDDDHFWHRGVMVPATGQLVFNYCENGYRGDFDDHKLEVDMEISTDGGETWSVLDGALHAAMGNFSALDDLIASPGEFICRFRYRGTQVFCENPNIKFPLA